MSPVIVRPHYVTSSSKAICEAVVPSTVFSHSVEEMNASHGSTARVPLRYGRQGILHLIPHLPPNTIHVRRSAIAVLWFGECGLAAVRDGKAKPPTHTPTRYQSSMRIAVAPSLKRVSRSRYSR